MAVSNYDEFEYDYSTYWKNRNYEHFAEVIALQKLLKNKEGNWFIDIGGSYGRHLNLYYSKFNNPILLDYSLNTLINNKERILEKYANTRLVAANVYHLPFKESVIDGAMMIRVLHHIEEPAKYFSELQRVLREQSTYIQEYANKMHIKAILKHILKRDFRFFSQTPFQQPTAQNFEGSNGVETTFINFHPKHIKSLMINNGFDVKGKLGTSILRIGILKKLIPLRILLTLDRIYQSCFSWTNAAPSAFLDCEIHKAGLGKAVSNNLEDILACPKCKGNFKFRNEECICSQCGAKFEKVAGIWDFRIQ